MSKTTVGDIRELSDVELYVHGVKIAGNDPIYNNIYYDLAPLRSKMLHLFNEAEVLLYYREANGFLDIFVPSDTSMFSGKYAYPIHRPYVYERIQSTDPLVADRSTVVIEQHKRTLQAFDVLFEWNGQLMIST